MTEIAGKAVLITGGAQGIGLGIARAFAREGAIRIIPVISYGNHAEGILV